MKRWLLIIGLALIIWALFLSIATYLSLERTKVKEEKVYVLKNCKCKDYLKFRKQYPIGILVDEKGNLCSKKCK